MSRVALVVGNGSYKRLGRLATPKNDASAIAAKLKKLHFAVDERVDLDKNEFTDALISFQDRMAGAEASLFFFAGHGYQFNDQNYLAPIDIEGEREGDLTWRSIEVKRVLELMSSFPQTSLVFLDACRESVVFRRWIERASTSATTRDMRLSFGFAPIENIKRLSNTYVAFSTEPGGLAIDSINGRNSPFVDALLTHIDEPGLSISDLMIQVRREVLEATDHRQVPWDESSLLTSFHFNPGDLIERHYFKAVIRESATALDVDGFLTRYPESEHFNESIKILKNQLKKSNDINTVEAYLSKMRNKECIRITEARLAELLWRPLQRSTDLNGINMFLERFPNHDDANERLAELHFMPIKLNPQIEALNEFIDKFAGTVAARQAAVIKQRERQKVFYQFVKEETRANLSVSNGLISSLALSALAIVSELFLIVVNPFQFSIPAATLLSGVVFFGVAANRYARRRSATNFEACLGFLALTLTSLLFSSALALFFEVQIFGLPPVKSLIWLWSLGITAIGAAEFSVRVRSLSLILSLVHGATIGVALSAASEQLFYAGREYLIFGAMAVCLLWRAYVIRKISPSKI